MFWKKKRPAEDVWAIGQGTWEDRPVIVRINQTVAKRRDLQRRLHNEVKVVVPFKEATEDGLPTSEESDMLGSIEARLSAEIETIGETIMVGVITTSGMREFAFYTDSPREVHLALVKMREEIIQRDVQFAVQDDPEWTVYKEIAF